MVEQGAFCLSIPISVFLVALIRQSQPLALLALSAAGEKTAWEKYKREAGKMPVYRPFTSWHRTCVLIYSATKVYLVTLDEADIFVQSKIILPPG